MFGEVLRRTFVRSECSWDGRGCDGTYLCGIADFEEAGTSIENCGVCVSGGLYGGEVVGDVPMGGSAMVVRLCTGMEISTRWYHSQVKVLQECSEQG
jgi:hypothetical protein